MTQKQFHATPEISELIDAETREVTRLVAFVTATLWALVIVVPLSWHNKESFFLSPSYDISVAAVLGGALYGLGTFINGACMFGTVARIARAICHF
jgi:toxin CptA